jgi:hypothetical protein
MVAVGVEQNLERHSKIAGGLPRIRAFLHQPSRRSLPQRVRRYAGTEAGEPDGALECRFDGIYRLAIELDEVPSLRIDPVPTPQMRK